MVERFPAGRLEAGSGLGSDEIHAVIDELAEAPANLHAVVRDLSGPQLRATLREGGWSLRDIVHHVTDSHINGFVRSKLAVAEATPRAASWDPDFWSRLEGSWDKDIAISVDLLDRLHRQWVSFLRSLPLDSFRRRVECWEVDQSMTLEYLLQLHAWHARHHTAQIAALREVRGW